MSAKEESQVPGGTPEAEEIPMAKVYQQIISLTNKPPSLRTDEELEQLVPWLRKKSSHLFQDLEDHKIKKLMKEADFRRYRFDDVIIRQGDIGDEFYILISGSISFHVNSADDLETMVQKQKEEEATAKEQGRPVNREVYGTQVGSGLEGKTFGELALIYPDCVRNATVISTNIYSDVLVVSKDLYNETLIGSQTREFEAKEKFVRDCPLFHKWNQKYRKMAAMSIEKVSLKFEDIIVKQGSPVNGLHFLVSGQVKIRVDPGMHPLQYPQHFPVGDIADLERQKARELLRKEMNLERQKSGGKKAVYERRSLPQDSAKKTGQRALELCLMGAVDTIGDLEMVLNLPSYSQTIVCTEAATIYHLDQRNYDRLVEKKNPQTVDLMRDIVHTKLTLHFSRLPDDSIPMYRYILYTLDEREREHREKQQQQRQQQHVRGRPTSSTATATAEAQWDIDHLQKGPLVNLYGPGSVFHLIRTKAKERQQRQQRVNATGSNNNPAFRFGTIPHQPSPLGRTPLIDNSRLLYADETSSISDGHVVNIYGYNENEGPRFVHGDLIDYEQGDGVEQLRRRTEDIGPTNKEDLQLDDFYQEEEDEDWATSDVALTNLEERLMRWHNSLDNAAPRPSPASKRISTAALVASSSAPSAYHNGHNESRGEHCVVKLHRFHFEDENRPKPGNKVYVRGRGRQKSTLSRTADTSSSSPEPEKSFLKYLLSSPPSAQADSERQYDLSANQNGVTFDEGNPKPLQPKRANSATVSASRRCPNAFKKPKSRHQYTVEEYECLKEELRRRQKAYKSFLPQRSTTSLF